MAGRLLPSYPFKRALPWVLAVVAVAALVYGLIAGNGEAMLLGVIALAGVVVAFPLARLVAGKPPEEDE